MEHCDHRLASTCFLRLFGEAVAFELVDLIDHFRSKIETRFGFDASKFLAVKIEQQKIRPVAL